VVAEAEQVLLVQVAEVNQEVQAAEKMAVMVQEIQLIEEQEILHQFHHLKVIQAVLQMMVQMLL
jgi:hypothetical protein